MKYRVRGYTLVEMTTVLAISSILAATTIPLGAFWVQRAQLTEGAGELSQSFGKAISSALKNQHALDATEPGAAVCISDTNQVTVLEADGTTLPNCATGDGVTIWNSTLPGRLELTSNDIAVSCMCFNTTGQLTTNNCTGCLSGTEIDLSVGSKTDTLHVH